MTNMESKIDYRKAATDLRKAWLKYKKDSMGSPNTLSISSFAAGWNASQSQKGKN